jgi:uncharacterized membrane protein YdbT with pleckstrin-like domain
MGYIERNLIPGEEVLYKTRLHSVAVLLPMTVGLLMGIAGLVCFYTSITSRQDANDNSGFWTTSGLVLIVLGGATIGVAILNRNATEMAVTNRRILIKSGVISRRTIELLLSRVESIVITEPFFGRVLGYGTVIVRGTGGTPEPFGRIAHPMEFRRCVQEQIEAQRSRPAGNVTS